MGTDADFRPRAPDPLRTHILYETRAHPTQAATPLPTTLGQSGQRVLGVYFTSNGFCACLGRPELSAGVTRSPHSARSSSVSLEIMRR